MKFLIMLIGVFLFAQNPFELINKIDSYNPQFIQKYKVKRVKKKKIKVVKKEVENIKLVLKAIFNKTAFINNKALKVGEEIYGYKVVDIRDKSVILKKGNKFMILRPMPKFVKVSR